MSSSQRGYLNNPNAFCYICRRYSSMFWSDAWWPGIILGSLFGLESAKGPMPPREDHLVLPAFHCQILEICRTCSTAGSSGAEFEGSCSTPKQFSQEELGDLIWDLSMSKQASAVFASRLKENYLKLWAKITAYWTREETSMLQPRLSTCILQ